MSHDVTINNPDTEEVTELDALDADGPAAHVREVERIVRDAVTARPAVPATTPDHVLAQVLRPGDQLVVQDLEHLLDAPVAARGDAAVYDAPSFVQLVKRLGHPARTTLWARQPSTGATTPTITAVFDDHEDHLMAGWREHRATLTVRVDPDWQAWAQIDGKNLDQVRLAEFLTDQLHVITQPRAAELVSAVTTFSTRRNVTFSQAFSLDTGETQFTYVDKAGEDAGAERLPNRLTLSLRPFYGAPETLLEVWLRYRLADGKLTFLLQRIRPDRAEEAAWADVCGQVAAELPDLPMLQGAAPAPLR